MSVGIVLHRVTSVTVIRHEIRQRKNGEPDFDAYTIRIVSSDGEQDIDIYTDGGADIGLDVMLAEEPAL